MSGAGVSDLAGRRGTPAPGRGRMGRRRRFHLSETLPLVAPSVLLLLVWMIVPLAMTLYFSFRRYNLLNPMLHGWAGLSNYRYLVESGALWSALLVTIIMVGAVLAITVVFGAVFAALFANEFPGQGIARVLVISPFFVMPTVSALVWKNLLMNPVNGLIGYLTRAVGLGAVDWFGRLPLISIIWIVAWEWLPFAFLILFTSIQSVDESSVEAARLDGAGPIAIFRHIQVPHMGRAISVVVMMETIFLIGIFAEIFVTTAGGPGIATTNLAFLIYQRALLAFNVGGASAAGVIAIILANIMALFLINTVAKRLDV